MPLAAISASIALAVSGWPSPAAWRMPRTPTPLARSSAVRPSGVLGREVGAVLDQERHELRIAALRGAVERGLVGHHVRARDLARARPQDDVVGRRLRRALRHRVPALGDHPGIDVGSGVEQEFHRRQHALVGAVAAARHAVTELHAGRRHQRRHAFLAGQVHQRLVLQQQLDERRVARARGAQQRRGALRQDGVAAAVLRHVAIRRAALQLQVRVGALREQQLRHVERRHRVLARQHRHRAVALGGQGADVGRHVERRAAEEVPLVHVGAAVDERNRDLEVEVHQRHHQWRDPLGILEVGVGPGREQVLRALDAALARGIQERGEAAAVHVLGTRLGDDLALPLADGAAGVEVGALRRQELHHLGLALRRGPHQRRLLAEGLAGVDVGTGLDEQPGGFDLAAARRRHQRRFTLGVG